MLDAQITISEAEILGTKHDKDFNSKYESASQGTMNLSTQQNEKYSRVISQQSHRQEC